MLSPALLACERWVDEVVVGHGLCPFAAPVIRKKQLQLVESTAATEAQCYQDYLQALNEFVQADPDSIATCILVFSDGLSVFDEYLKFLSLAEEALDQVGLAGKIQLASFHPAYVFEGSDDTDPANFTNRSPYPMLHFLREAQMTQALSDYPDAASIPERNVRRFRDLGVEKLIEQLANCRQSSESKTDT